MKRTRAITLRTYPFRESDRVAIFFSEEFGILRGVARGSLKMKSKMAGALEPMTLVNLRFIEPHGRELVMITGCEAIRSLYHQMDDISVAASAGLIAEITLESHGERDPDPDFFRLLELAQRALRAGIDPQLTARYFELFSLKLTGVLPPSNDVRNHPARQLMQTMLKTNLLEMEEYDPTALQQFGRYLQRLIFLTLGKKLRAYDFAARLHKLSSKQDSGAQLQNRP